MTDKEKLPTLCSGEKWCPLTATTNLISKKWHPVIIHRLLEEGGTGFNQLKKDVGGISSKVLSESLEDLEEKSIIDREVVSEKPFRVKYSLTERGQQLEDAIDELIKWGSENLREACDKDESIA